MYNAVACLLTLFPDIKQKLFVLFKRISSKGKDTESVKLIFGKDDAVVTVALVF